MKNKRFTVNLTGIGLALLIAFGSIFALWSRLDKERTDLLAGGGQVEIPIKSESMVSQSVGVVDIEMKTEDLTQEELRQAVELLESTSEKYPHEPVTGQLSMTEAIQSGLSWLGDFFLPHIGREEAVPREYRMSCYLWAGEDEQTEQNGRAAEAGRAGNVAEDETENPLLGYWEVSLTGKEMDAVLLLNAVTGQVLRAWIALPFPVGERLDKDSLSALLEDYADSLGLETNYVISETQAGDSGNPVHGLERQGTDEDGAGSPGLGGDGAGTPGSGEREAVSPEKGGYGKDGMDNGEDWAFRQRLENHQMAVCLEAGEAVSPQARLTDSKEALCFALYLETKASQD